MMSLISSVAPPPSAVAPPPGNHGNKNTEDARTGAESSFCPGPSATWIHKEKIQNCLHCAELEGMRLRAGSRSRTRSKPGLSKSSLFKSMKPLAISHPK